MKYDNIINHPHHVSSRHPHMSLNDRAAQFAPFAALTGHSEAIDETARLTQEYAELDAERIALINQKLAFLASHLWEKPLVTVRYFQPDLRKDGGSYLEVTGTIKKIDEYNKVLLLAEDECTINLEDIYDIKSDILG